MRRAQVYVDDEAYEAMGSRAFTERTSTSSLLQQWVREQTPGAPKQRRDAAGLLALAKRLNLHDTVRDVSERHDDCLWGLAE